VAQDAFHSSGGSALVPCGAGSVRTGSSHLSERGDRLASAPRGKRLEREVTIEAGRELLSDAK